VERERGGGGEDRKEIDNYSNVSYLLIEVLL
jgi:hypothetical protein